jgi:hypothetical protein
MGWPFFLILAAAFLANEKLKQQYARLYFQLSLFFLSLFCFTIFILPVVLHAIGPLIFLLSGAVSLALMYLFLRLLGSTLNVVFGRLINYRLLQGGGRRRRCGNGGKAGAVFAKAFPNSSWKSFRTRRRRPPLSISTAVAVSTALWPIGFLGMLCV